MNKWAFVFVLTIVVFFASIISLETFGVVSIYIAVAAFFGLIISGALLAKNQKFGFINSVAYSNPSTFIEEDKFIWKRLVWIVLLWGLLYLHASNYMFNNFGVGLFFLITLVVGLVPLFILFFIKPDSMRDLTVTKAFLKSMKLRPALAGLVVTEFASYQGVVATIMDLIQRGNLKLDSKKVVLENVKATGLDGFEKEIISLLFSNKKKLVLKDVYNSFYKKMGKLNRVIYEAGMNGGFFVHNPALVRRSFLKKPKFVAIVVVIVAVLVGYVPFDNSEPIGFFYFFVGASSFASFLVMNLISAFAPRRTEKGVLLFREYKSLKHWLEKHPLENVNLSTDFLPFLNVFTVNKHYLNMFSNLCLEVRTDSKGRQHRSYHLYDDGYSFSNGWKGLFGL